MDTALPGRIADPAPGGNGIRPPKAAGHAWATWGLILGITLSAIVVLALAYDRNTRIEASARQRTAVASGIEVLLRNEIGHLERTLRSLGREADQNADRGAEGTADIGADIRDVVAGNPELLDIELFTPTGSAARPDPDGGMGRAVASDSDFRIGDLEAAPRSQAVLPLALHTPGNNWLVARMRISALRQLLDSVDAGRSASAAILDREGRVLARAGTGNPHPGTSIALPSLPPDQVSHAMTIGSIDGVRRYASFAASSQHPFVVAVETPEDAVLGTWRSYAYAGLALLLCYWVGFIHASRSLTRSEQARVAAQSELVRHADWLGKAQDASRAGVWALDLDTDLVRATGQAAALFGLEAKDTIVPLQDFLERMHPEDRPHVQALLAEAIAGDGTFQSEYRIFLPDGRVRWIAASGGRVGLESGAKLMTGTIVDVTERRNALQEIARAERQFRELFDSNPLPFWVFEVDSLRFLAVNDTAVRKYGYSVDEFLSMTILDIRPDEDRQAAAVSAAHPEERESDRIWRHRTRDGSAIFVRAHSSPIEFDGRNARLVLAEDVSERVAYEQRLAWQASHNETTGLLKLGALLAEVDGWNRNDGIEYAVLYLQLRDLEIVAPTLGRRLGQAIVTEVAGRLAAIAADFGPLAYVPADAFVLVSSDAGQVDLLCQRVSAAMAEPVEFDGGRHRVDAWMGVAKATTGAQARAEVAVDHAALAALQSRNTAEGTATYFEGMAEESAQRLALVAGLRDAIARDELELHFQPIVSVGSGRVTAAEALLRWRAPGGYVPPALFVPLAEESGQIVAIGQRVIEQAAQARRELDRGGFADVAVSVNVSAMQLSPGEIDALTRRLIEATDASQGRFHVEITETAVLKNQDAVHRALETLRAARVDISIDDFGTGFSSMSYLRDLPLDYLKIDRSFVSGVDQDGRNASICRALIALAHGIGLQVIAEGVEHRAEYDWLAAHGCDHVQGYFVARPGPLDGLLACLAAQGRPAGRSQPAG
jgi:PAS domain S-box-containing protein